MTDNRNKDDEKARRNGTKTYEVGYGKPPEASRFRKGQSGNPLGRPRRRISLAQAALDELNSSVKVRNDPNRRILGVTAMAKNLVARAVNGDIKAAKLLFEVLKTLPPEPALPTEVRITTRFVRAGDPAGDDEPK